MNVTFAPLKDRPTTWRPAHQAGRPSSPFRATYSWTVELLDRELHQLGAVRATVQVSLVDPAGVRVDGGLRANARGDHPGVILTVETRRHGTLVYDCDRFVARPWDLSWQVNLRAIALGLEALRKVERYGIADSGEQYRGFAELGSGTPMGSGQMSVDEAAELLSSESIESRSGRRVVAIEKLLEPGDDRSRAVRFAYRVAAKKHHPDIGGDPDLFRRLGEARDLLMGRMS